MSGLGPHKHSGVPCMLLLFSWIHVTCKGPDYHITKPELFRFFIDVLQLVVIMTGQYTMYEVCNLAL